MRTAQRMLLKWMGILGSEDYEGFDLRLAAQQTSSQRLVARAPHAYRGTPPCRHWSSPKKMTKLFRGHRP